MVGMEVCPEAAGMPDFQAAESPPMVAVTLHTVERLTDIAGQ